MRAGREAAVYVLNKKRAELADIEQRYGVKIEVIIDESFEGAKMTVDSSGAAPVAAPRAEFVAIEEDTDEEPGEAPETEDEDEAAEEAESGPEGERQARRRRRRRGGRGRRREGREPMEAGEAVALQAPVHPGGLDTSRMGSPWLRRRTPV